MSATDIGHIDKFKYSLRQIFSRTSCNITFQSIDISRHLMDLRSGKQHTVASVSIGMKVFNKYFVMVQNIYINKSDISSQKQVHLLVVLREIIISVFS